MPITFDSMEVIVTRAVFAVVKGWKLDGNGLKCRQEARKQ